MHRVQAKFLASDTSMTACLVIKGFFTRSHSAFLQQNLKAILHLPQLSRGKAIQVMLPYYDIRCSPSKSRVDPVSCAADPAIATPVSSFCELARFQQTKLWLTLRQLRRDKEFCSSDV